jgi:hypothetical protein
MNGIFQRSFVALNTIQSNESSAVCVLFLAPKISCERNGSTTSEKERDEH